MSDQFDWRTDDEVCVDEPVMEPEPVTAVTRCLPWFFATGILIFLIILVGVSIQQVSQRIEATQKSIEADILSAHELVLTANGQQDVELFRTLLSGRDSSWTEVQLGLVAAGHLFDRQGLGLQAQPDNQTMQVTVSPDLQATELIFEQAYAWQNADGITETVRLQQMAVYQRGQQWLYAPPTADYWGDLRILDGRSLSITYPQRDEALVQQLAADLEKLIADVCRLPDMDCPPRLHLYLRLSSEPESLLETADAQTLLNHTLSLNLPTPSLIGLPIDEAGYEALRQGYSIHLAAAIISQQSAYQCCSPELLHQALLDWHLTQLGLRAWPLTADYYEKLLFGNINSEDFRRFWYWPPTTHDLSDAYVLVQFLATNSAHLSPIASQRLLSQPLTYDNWLMQVVGANAHAPLLQFIVDQGNLSVSGEPPIPWPQEGILYVCDDHELQQQDFQTGLVTDVVLPNDEAAHLELSPLADGYVIEAYNHILQPQTTWVDGKGRSTILLASRGQTDPTVVIFFGGAFDPTGRYFSVNLYSPEDGGTPALLDSADCESGICQTVDLPGWPLWSPSGQSMVLLGETAVTNFLNYAPLYLANARGQNRVLLADNVVTYAWLDDQTVAYIRLDGGEQIVVTRELDSGLELVTHVTQAVADLQTK